MPKSVDACNKILALVFNATTFADVAENDTTSPATNIYVALHTADPTAAGTQASSETAYTNYARVAVARTTGGWDAPSGGATANAALIQFPQCGVTGATLTHVSVGLGASGATAHLYSGELTAPLAVANGIQPQFAAGALDITEE